METIDRKLAKILNISLKQTELFGGVAVISDEVLAKKYHMTLQSLANWRVQGKGPQAVKLPGRKIAYTLRDIAAWEKDQVLNSANENVLIR